MKELEVFFHGIGQDNVKLIRVQEDFLIVDVLKAAKGAGVVGILDETCEIFLEESEEPVDKKHSLRHLGVKGRAHFIYHHCKKIEVSVSYNGEVKKTHFSPAVKIGKVLKWAIKAFGLTGTDATDKVLRLENKEELANDIRLGSLVHHPHCHIELFLTATVRVEG